MSLELDVILADSDSTLEVAIEIDSAKRSDSTLKTWYFSTNRGRATGPSDSPANEEFKPFVFGVGPLVQSLTEDMLFAGLASGSSGSIILLQKTVDSDQLSEFYDYVFAGYVCRIKIGRITDAYADFVLFRTTTIDIDPSVEITPQGLQATFILSSVLGKLLAENLNIKKYVGIPTCAEVLTTTAVAQASYNAAHDLTSFTIMYKVLATSNPAAARNLLAKSSSAANNNYSLNYNTSGFIECLASLGGVGTTLHTSAVNLSDSIFHTIVWGLLDKSTSYLMIDDILISTFTPTASVNLPAVGVRMARFLIGKHCDARIYNRYIPPDEAKSIASIRSDGQDLGCVGCWRFDDGGSATAANDYSSTGADATWTGVLNTDYRWTNSDLGEPELAGQSYPLVVGNVLNVKADLIDSVRERYRGNVDATGWHTSTSDTTLTVKSQGTVLTGGGVDYTAPTNGGGGVFSMTSSEAEPVTFDLLNDGDNEQNVYPTSVAKSVLVNRTRFTNSNIKNVEPMQLLCPWPSGYHTRSSDVTAKQVLQEVLGECGIYFYEDSIGDLTFDMLMPPTGYGPYGEPVYDFLGQPNGISFGDIGGVSGNFTIAGWFKINLADQTAFDFSGATLGRLNFLGKSNFTGNYYLSFQTVGADAGKIDFRSAGVSLKSPVGSVAPYQWYFIGAVFDDTNNIMRLYLAPKDGTLIEIANIANTNSPITNSDDLQIGTGVSYAWMSVQHMQVWNSAKSLAQLQALMATPPVGNESGLLAYIPLNEGFGTPTELVSGNFGPVLTGDVRAPEWRPKFTINLNDTPSIKLSDLHYAHPAWNIVVEYNRNRFPMQNSDIDTGVSQNDRLKLTSPFLTAPFESQSIKDKYKKAKKIEHHTSITDVESAQRLLRNTLLRNGTNNFVGSVSFPSGLNISRLACGLQIGDEIGIVGSFPSPIQTAQCFKVVSTAPSPVKWSNNVVVWK